MRAQKFIFAFAISLLAICFSQAFSESLPKNVLYLCTKKIQSQSELFFSISNSLQKKSRLCFQSSDFDANNAEGTTEQIENDFFLLQKFDAIISADAASFNFIEKNYEKYFSNTPLIFLGISQKDFSARAKKMYGARIIEPSIFLDENIKLAMSLFPSRKKLAFVGNSFEQKSEYQAKIKNYEIDSEFFDTAKKTKTQIEQWTFLQTNASIIFLSSQDESNSAEILKWILQATECPVFVCRQADMQSDVLGGYYSSQAELGAAAARALNHIFAYKVTDAVTPNSTPQGKYFFNARQMRKFKIKKSQVSSNAIFFNDAEISIETKAGLLLLFAGLALSFAIATALAVFFAQKKIKSQKEWLNEERLKLNTVLSQSETLFWECIFESENSNSKKSKTSKNKNPENQTLHMNVPDGWISAGLIPQEHIERYNNAVQNLINGEKSVSIELPLLQEDKQTHLADTKWKRIVYKAISQIAGKTIKAIAIATDITNQKRAEEEYKGEMSYRAFLNKEFPVYTRLNLTNNVVLERVINVPELKLNLQSSTADAELALIAKTATYEGQNIGLPSALTRKELFSSFVNGTRTRQWDFYFPFSNGIIRWYTLIVEIASNPYTSCIESNIYFREITEQKIMAISKDSVLDEEVEYIFWLDLSCGKCNLIHKAANSAWIPIGGNYCEYNAVVKYMLEEAISSKDLKAAREFFDLKRLTMKLCEKTAANCTFEIITNNLRIAIKQMRAYYLRGNQNVILFIGRDITDITLFEKLQNEKLSHAIEQAQRANASKSDFLSRMSHDLRTPMNGIIGMAELAEDEIGNPESVKEDIRKIKSSSKYMLGLLNDILDMAKIESGKLEIRKSRQSAGDIIETITTMASSMCETAKINFYCNVDPQKYRNFYINVDRLHLQQVIMNLLSNASKFTPEGGKIEFLIKIVSRTENAVNAQISISDTGSGMTKEFQKIMFEAFTQDANSINKVGTGLGLSIVKNLLDLMGATITCESAPGKGTTFVINIELEFLGEASQEEAQKSSNKNSAQANLKGKRILLVEDNPLNQEISRRVLQKKGMEVTLAENGLLAVEAFSKSAEKFFDLILMDMMMPVMGGIEAAEKIRALDREDAKSVPIIALTANAFTEDIQKCLDAGMNTHLSKPINPVLLISTISQFFLESKN